MRAHEYIFGDIYSSQLLTPKTLSRTENDTISGGFRTSKDPRHTHTHTVGRVSLPGHCVTLNEENCSARVEEEDDEEEEEKEDEHLGRKPL